LSNVNQVTPQGNITYDQTGNYNFTDPTTQQTFDIPKFTVTQSLSPIGQQTLDQSNQAKLNLASLGNMSSAQLQQLLGSGINLSNLPAGGDQNLLARGSQNEPSSYLLDWDPNYQQQRTFDDAGALTRDYDTSQGTQQRANVENALFQRMQPQNDRDRANLESRLADQGIKYGSPAFQAAMDNYNRGINDQRLGITAQGGQEQKLQDDLAAQRAGFQNSAQQQAYQQALGRGNYANTAQTNAFQQAASRAQLWNAAAAQRQSQAETLFNAQQTARAQALSEQYSLRNQPINEITALLSQSQVSNPTATNVAQNKIPTTDIAGLINNNFSQSLDAYKQQSTNYNQIVGGLFSAIGSIGGAAYGATKSDVRSKENIHKVGSVFAAAPQKLAEPESKAEDRGEASELPIYTYSYKDDPASIRHLGPMAQDVEKLDPNAVLHDRQGTKYIDNRRMGGLLKAA
jgi:hypothetical protein